MSVWILKFVFVVVRILIILQVSFRGSRVRDGKVPGSANIRRFVSFFFSSENENTHAHNKTGNWCSSSFTTSSVESTSTLVSSIENQSTHRTLHRRRYVFFVFLLYARTTTPSAQVRPTILSPGHVLDICLWIVMRERSTKRER